MSQTGEEQPKSSGSSEPVRQYRASARPTLRGTDSASDAYRQTPNAATDNHQDTSHEHLTRKQRREQVSRVSDTRTSANPQVVPQPEVAPPHPTTAPPSGGPAQPSAQPPAQQPPAQAQPPAHQPRSPHTWNTVYQWRTPTEAERNPFGTGGAGAAGGTDLGVGDQLEHLPGGRAAAAQARHATRRYDAFPAIVGWTSLGTLLPGLALIHNNRRSVVGWFLLSGFVGGILLILALIAWYGPIRVMAKLVSSPWILNTIAVLLILGLLTWVFVILRSYMVTARHRLMSGSQSILAGVLVVSLLLIVCVPLGAGAAFSRVSGQTIARIFGEDGSGAATRAEIWKDKPRINVFLIGRDNGANRMGTRPDTMLVASIDTRSGESTLISVPRNLAYPIFPEGSNLARVFPDGFNAYGEDSLINAVWQYATDNPDDVGDPGGLETGMFATMQAVEGSLGLKLDYWASVDMQGFRDLVDAMGGIKIDVERPIPMGGGSDQYTGAKNEIFDWIDPGEQRLDGFQALWYVRSRDGADNYDRMCRQQRMIKTTLDQVNPSELALKFPQLANSSTKNIATDINKTELGGFVELAWEMKNTKIKSAQINNEVTPTYRPDFDVLQKWVDDQLNPQEPSQAEKQNAPKPAPTDQPSDEPTTDAPSQGAPAPGVENTDGKCYPTGYTPGDPWPGYPGPDGGQGVGGNGVGGNGMGGNGVGGQG